METGHIDVPPRPKSPNLGGRRPGAGRPPKKRESFEAAQRRKESALADLRQIEVAVRRGALLEKDAVQREWEDVLRMIRSRIMATVSRIRTRQPHLTALDAQIIDEELRTALTELGEDRVDGPKTEA